MNRRLSRSRICGKLSDSQFLFLHFRDSYPRTITTIKRRKQREDNTICFQRLIGKIVLVSLFLGGILMLSANAVFAFVPNNGMSTLECTMRRNYAPHAKTTLSSSKIAPDRTDQMNATRNNSDIDVYKDNLVQQNVVNNENTHSSGENFFHDDYDSILKSQTDGVDSLERLLIEDINDDKAGKPESTIPLTRKLESDQDDSKSSTGSNILQLGNRTNNTRSIIRSMQRSIT